MKKTRLTKKELKTIINLIKKGNSLNSIVKLTGKNKTTIYYHFREIKGRVYPKIKLNQRFTEKEGEIVGIFAGDGSQYFDPKGYHYQVNIHFGSKNKDYVFYVKNLFEDYFNHKFNFFEDKKRHTIRLRINSKKVFNYFKHYLDYNSKTKHSTVKLKSLNLPKEFIIGFLRGLIDTDGSVLYNKYENGINVSFCTTSLELINQVKQVFDEYNFKYSYFVRKHKSYKDLHNIKLWKRSVEPFLNHIKPFKVKRLGPVSQPGNIKVRK